jgi:putative sterol carrier protein
VENQNQSGTFHDQTWEADSPALAGVFGRMRLGIGGKSVGVLVVDDGHLSLTEDDVAVDVTISCATRADLIKLLRGEINPVVATLRGIVRVRGDAGFALKVVLGLRAGSPFVRTPFDGKET